MTAQIHELIEGSDAFELVRDKIAAILLEEQANQQSLATADSQDPRLWALRIFIERSNPWSQFTPSPNQIDAFPIVNVSVARGDVDAHASNTVERQKWTVVYNVDCYGYGVSAEAGAGHVAGDSKAALEAQRAYRLVRRILMAAHYTYLGLTRGTVWRRFPQDFEVFNLPAEDRPVEHVVGLRFRLAVDFSEFSPQVQGEIMEEINVTLKRASTGEVYLNTKIPVP